MCVKCNVPFLMGDLEVRCICIKLCFRLGTTESGINCSPAAFTDNVMAWTQTSGCFSQFDFIWRMWGFRLSPDRLLRSRHAECSQNFQSRPQQYHFRDQWKVKPFVWNMPANSTGLEHVVDLYDVCLSCPPTIRSSDECLLASNCWMESKTTSWGPLQFLLVSNNKITTMWASFPGYTRHLGISADHATHNSKKFVPVVLPATPYMMDSMHKFRRAVYDNDEDNNNNNNYYQ